MFMDFCVCVCKLEVRRGVCPHVCTVSGGYLWLLESEKNIYIYIYKTEA